MTGPQLRMLRERFALSRRKLAEIIRVSNVMLIYHWEKEYYRISRDKQLKLGVLFHELGKRLPPTEICPLCQGSGLIKDA